ncbi:hypothetical protein [Niveibacterium umoris]|uniref:Uncharacterized protein n=1 Tax=Niveibacterium umoris TaxID=1193620 RepID=A0A840BDU4_9RHOO|nr:hypothetical protein [Niveibacterium umoris]MBB4011701.1 hypothetical protein [Niveibacterium umoris]
MKFEAIQANTTACSGITRALGLALSALLALALAGCASWLDRSTPEQEKARRFESQLQLRVMRFADGYVDAVSRAAAKVEADATDSALRYRLVEFQIKQSTAAIQIAAGPNPNINAVDMVVLAALTHATVKQNLVPLIGATKAQPVIETFSRMETGAWSLVDFLTPAQLADLHRRLDAWAPDAASLDSVAFNRLADFAKASGLPADDQNAAGSILVLIGADPLAGMNPALQEVERSRILAERAIYYAERTPMLMDMQMRALSTAIANMPESRSLLSTSNRVGESAALLAETAAKMPDTFSKEREATIRQLLTALEQQQGAMKELLVEVRGSLDAGRGASDSIQGVLDRTDALMRRLKVGEPPPPGAVPGRPFDITEYTQTAIALGEATKQMQALVTMLDHDVPAATRLGDAMRGHAERLLDHLFKRVMQAFGMLFVGVLLIVLASRLFGAYLAQRTARIASGGKPT